MCRDYHTRWGLAPTKSRADFWAARHATVDGKMGLLPTSDAGLHRHYLARPAMQGRLSPDICQVD